VPGDVIAALERLTLPVFALTRDQMILWLNPAATELVGDAAGRRFTDVVAPESQQAVRDAFARKLVGSADATMYEAVVVRPSSEHVTVEINSVPLEEGGHVVGVFGIAVVEGSHAPRRSSQELTPRQAQTLQLLARGHSTQQMAEAMGISPETVRNHVREVLRKLGAHSRLEAVMLGRERGLV
jgi:PAS domain S-box-containing protein